MKNSEIAQKLWGLCNLLRNDGITYRQYVTELTYILFLKMLNETNTEMDIKKDIVGLNELRSKKTALSDIEKAELNEKEEIESYSWNKLVSLSGIELKKYYNKMLNRFGTHCKGHLSDIYHNARSNIDEPKNLEKIITNINNLDWYSIDEVGIGDLYEGLLEKNANEKKSGGGQYFTPRVLIDVMTELVAPQVGELCNDPACGTFGFMIAANKYVREHNDMLKLSPEQYSFQKHKAFSGCELLQDTHRLALMNAMIHGIDSEIILGDTLSNKGKAMKNLDVVLTNPPFGIKKGGETSSRDDFTFSTSNTQLNFLQHIYRSLKANGKARAAVVLPDNVLFADGDGSRIREDLMNKCNLHTILRLPTGIFFAHGVKTNVLFFTRGKTERNNTKEVWVYDLRTNMAEFAKTNQLKPKDFDGFIKAYTAKARSKVRDERWSCYTRGHIKDKNNSLDIGIIKDDTIFIYEDLSNPIENDEDAIARSHLDEKQIVNSVATEFKRLGYEVFDGLNEDFGTSSILGRINSSEAVLRKYLQDSIRRLNPGENQTIIDQTIMYIMECSKDERLILKNLVFYNYIKHGVIVNVKIQGKEVTKLIKVIDWDHAENNYFTIVTNYHLTDAQHDRYINFVGFINGIPLMLIEMKSNVEGVIEAAQNQMNAFISEFPKLFWYNALIIFYNGVHTFVGCVKNYSSNVFKWNKPKNNGNSLNSLLTLVKNVCAKEKLLDRVENFTLFSQNNGQYKKTIARDYQIQAVNIAYKAVNEVEKNKGRLGIVQQAQGSGRTETILCFVQKILRKMPGKWSFIIVTDRVEHEEGLFRMFEMTGIVADKRAKAQNGEQLRELLSGNSNVIFTTIQKFNTSDDALVSERRNIIVLVNEASTSQYGAHALNMRKVIPNAAFIGFTSTTANGLKNIEVFGECISTYSLNQAIEDDMSIPVYYEVRLTHVHINREMPKMKRVVLKYEYRQDVIAKDIVSHFMSRKFMGKAMVVSNDIKTSYLLYKKVKKYWNEYIENLQNEIVLNNPERAKESRIKLYYMQETEICIVSSHNNKEENNRLGYKFQDPNDKLRLVFVCSMWLTGIDVPNLDTIYLDKEVNEDTFMKIIGRTTRKYNGKVCGTIIDYIGIQDSVLEATSEFLLLKDNDDQGQIQHLSFEESASVSEKVEIYKLEDELTRLGEYIGKGCYQQGRECLIRIITIDNEKGKELAEELAFLYNIEGSVAQDEESWNKYKTQIDWKCRIWTILSENCKFEIIKSDTNCKFDINDTDDNESTDKDIQVDWPVYVDNDSHSSVQRGNQLESAMLELLEEFFKICEDSKGDILKELRKQNNGHQFGFDLKFCYIGNDGQEYKCLMECKNYSNPIPYTEIANKLEEVELNYSNEQHWILVSPKTNVENKLEKYIEQWEEKGRYSFKIHIWSPQNHVENFFAIKPLVYDKFGFIPSEDKKHPSEWSDDERLKNIEFWRNELQPLLQMSPGWRNYIKEPIHLLLKKEREKGKEYIQLYESYVDMRCQDAAGNDIEGTLEEYLRKWLLKEDKKTIVLLGEFGDGKTFFTYSFSRNLIKDFVQLPRIGWIPLRFSLQDLTANIDGRDFLKRRLEEFNTDVKDWYELKSRYNILVIFDGFDEMSKKLDNITIKNNAIRLIKCYNSEFTDVKVIITSRKHFFEDRKNKHLFVDKIGRPDIIQLASISRQETMGHLSCFAKSDIEKSEKLKKLQSFHDPIGLARKPLFLQMIKDNLKDLPEEDLDVVTIYETNIKKSLKRKLQIQLEEEFLADEDENINNMVSILEKVALKLHESEKEYICLSQFKDDSKTCKWAEMLWNITSPELSNEEDAEAHVAVRSLLMRVNVEDEDVDFENRLEF